MKKIFSFLAAVLFAGSMMAETYVKTAYASIKTGDVLIVTMENATSVYAASNDGGTSSAPKAVAVTVASNVITTDATNILWTATKDGDNITFKAGDNAMYCTNTNNGVRVGTNANNVFSIKDDYLFNNATSRYVGVYNSADFRCYTSINSNIANQTLAFFVKGTVGPEVPATAIELDQAALTLTEGETATLTATLTPAGATTAVTWTSSDEAVATVSDGKVTAEGAGTATITATAGTLTATCAVTVNAAPALTCAQANALADGENAKLGEFTVAYVNGAYAYICDATGYALIYAFDYGLKAGDKVNGFKGKMSIYKGLPELVPSVEYTDLTITAGEAPAPVELADAPAAADVNKYVVMKGVSATGAFTTESKTTINVTFKEQSVAVYNNFRIAYEFDEAKSYDIVGAVSIYNTTVQVYFISATEHEEAVVDEWKEIKFTAATAVGAFNDSVFTAAGSEFSLKCVDTDKNKLKTTANNCSFGTVEDRHDYQFRLQTSGKSNNKNKMELNIPADGQLRIAVRSASGSDDTRTVVLVQGEDTIYNKAVSDKDTVAGAASPKIFNFVYVNVKAGKVAVAYPVNAVNFYSFAFKEGSVTPDPEHTYTVAGDSEAAFGKAWDPTYDANDMVKQADGSYKWEKENITLGAGTVAFKVCQDYDWAVAYPAGNYELAIAEAGIYTVTITYEPANENKVSAVATKTGDAVVIPTIAMHGNFTGNWKDTELFTLAADEKTATLALTLTAGNYEFGMRIGSAGNWTANGAAFTRADFSHVIVAGSGNLTLAADVDGEYIFTWTYETNILDVTYPAAPVEETKYCELPTGHLKDANFGDANGRILLTIAKGEGNNIIVKVKNNNANGNTKTGLNYLWVSAEGATSAKVVYGDGTHTEADVEEVSVVVPFDAAKESYNFLNIHWSYSGWDGEWAIDGLVVKASELCEEGIGTAIDNTEVAEKAVKMIENGQLFIIKNGVKYNAQGVVVK